MIETESGIQKPSRRYLYTLSLGALGVVYGDIGTSPLYALRECFKSDHGVAPTAANIYGVLSLIVWSLVIVISLKYLVFVMRADNRGEGGILALMSLARTREGGGTSRRRALLVALGLFGSALLYGDGMITPAISVLSAVEGIEIAAPAMAHYVVPITVLVLIVLFAVQRAGTHRVGALFGPIMMIWFAVIALLGVVQIARDWHILAAVWPGYAVSFFLRNRVHGFLVLGAVFLVVTGGEALYADMGHFGAQPIRIAWFTVVFPALLMNYFGQGALLLHGGSAEHPFFEMAPHWTRLPLIALATVATVIASQAVISGAFSLTRQAVQLGYIPRLQIRHTSAREIGQIYIPSVNWALMIAAIALVVTFKGSTALAAAYGVAVTATMAITTALLAVVERDRWHWPAAAVLALTVPVLIIDFSFFGANIIKIFEGGWFPLAVGLGVYLLMTTWARGRRILSERLGERAIGIDDFLADLGRGNIPRVRGTAVFMSRGSDGVPTTLLHNIKHNKVVHHQVVILTIIVEETSHLTDDERFEWRDLGNGVYRLVLRFGFMEEPDVPATISRIETSPFKFNPMSTSYFLGRETLVPTRRHGMALWREHLFTWMTRNASSAAGFFCLPANQVIELGAQIEM